MSVEWFTEVLMERLKTGEEFLILQMHSTFMAINATATRSRILWNERICRTSNRCADNTWRCWALEWVVGRCWAGRFIAPVPSFEGEVRSLKILELMTSGSSVLMFYMKG